MEILEGVRNSGSKSPPVAASGARPFPCPEEGCIKVGLCVVFPITLRTINVFVKCLTERAGPFGFSRCSEVNRTGSDTT